MEKMLKDQVAIITGGASGMGEATAKLFAEEGAKVVIADYNEKNARKVADEITAAGGIARVYGPVDVSSEAACNEVAQKTIEEFGRIDALIFNNNNVVKTDLEHLTREVFESQLNDNAKAAFVLARVIGLHMAEYHSGKIVFVSSIHCDKPTGSAVMYSISKGCINMLCKECALFFGRKGIQTNLIEAGAVEGDDEKFESTFSPLYAMGYMEERIPRRKAGSNDEIAAVAAFLASEEASFVNGASVRADGGFELFYGFRA